MSTKISDVLQPLRFDPNEDTILISMMRDVKSDFVTQWEAETRATHLLLHQNRERLDRFTDAYIDGLIDKETLERRKLRLFMERRSLEEKLSQPTTMIAHRMENFLELARNAYLLNKVIFPSERRELLRAVTSNRTVSSKNVEITLQTPFAEVANRHKYSNGSPRRDRHRTLDELLQKLIAWFTANPAESFDLPWTNLKHHTRSLDDAKIGDLAP